MSELTGAAAVETKRCSPVAEQAPGAVGSLATMSWLLVDGVVVVAQLEASGNASGGHICTATATP
jgi:hypothetical protein